MIEPLKIKTQIKSFDNKKLKQLADAIHREGVAVLYNQDMNEREYIDTIKKFGECEAPMLFMNPKE